jgi:hypothetical protein
MGSPQSPSLFPIMAEISAPTVGATICDSPLLGPKPESQQRAGRSRVLTIQSTSMYLFCAVTRLCSLEVPAERATAMPPPWWLARRLSSSSGGEHWRLDMINIGRAILAGTLALWIAAPALADAQHRNGGHGHHYGWYKHKGGPGVSRSAPGPLIGIGLPGLAAYGAYIWLRRRPHRK